MAFFPDPVVKPKTHDSHPTAPLGCDRSCPTASPADIGETEVSRFLRFL